MERIQPYLISFFYKKKKYRRTIDTLKFEIERLRLDNASKDNKLRNLEQLQKNLEDIVNFKT